MSARQTAMTTPSGHPPCPEGPRADRVRRPSPGAVARRGAGEAPPRLPLSPPAPVKGRGAVGNPPVRFERQSRHAFDDGWTPQDDADFAPAPLRTTVTVDATRTIIARNTSPDLGFDRSINPYRGCEHGCVYCFARPTHAWLGLSPGLDFESRLIAKPQAAALLDRELRRAGYRCRTIAMGANTDPYQPVERERKITRGVLETLAAFGHPVGIVTKSALVARDADILSDMAARGLAAVCLSITTLDRGLARRMEPRAAAPARRLATIRALTEAGVPVGVMVAPVVPGLTDPEMEAILEAARDAGASFAGYIPLRLPDEVKGMVSDWLDVHAPIRARKVLSTVRAMRDGRLNDPEFGSRMRGTGPFATLLEKRFVVATRKLGLARRPPLLRTDRFAVPPAPGDQLTLFDLA